MSGVITKSVVNKALVAIAILAVLALLILSFQKNFEYVEKTQWRPLTGEAKTNPLYASQLFLRRMGIPTQTKGSLQDLVALPGTDSVILISSSRQTLRTSQLSDLLGWVSNGGHLIIAGVADWNMFSDESPLVDEPEDSRNDDEPPENTEFNEDELTYYADLEVDEDTSSSSDIDPLQEFLGVQIREGIKFDNDKSETIRLKGSARALELGPDYYRAITLTGDNKTTGLEQVTVNGKNVIIRQQVDEGLITLVSDFDFINNFKLGKFDHAEILWQLIRGKSATLGQTSLLLPDSIWLFHTDETANLFELIWKHFWALVITLGLLFLTWVFRVSRRFGPLIAKETEDRRNLLEHIDASGAYYWKQKEQDVLLESTRAAAQQLLAKRIPGWHALSQHDQTQLLAKRLDLPESQLSKTLYGNISSSPYEFTQTIKQLEHIRISL